MKRFFVTLTVAGVAGFVGTAPGQNVAARQTTPPVPAMQTDTEEQTVIAGVSCLVRGGKIPGPTVLLIDAGNGDASPASQLVTGNKAKQFTETAVAKARAQITAWPLLRGRLVWVSASSEADAPALETFLSAVRPDWVVELRDGQAVKTPGFRVLTAPSAAPPVAAEARRLRKAVSASAAKTSLPLGPLAAAAQIGESAPPPVVQAVAAGRGLHPSLSVRTRFLRRAAALLLADLGIIAPGSENRLTPPDVAPGVVRVAMYDSDGAAGLGPNAIEKALSDKPGFCFRRVCATDIQNGALGGFDALVNPGGSSRKQGQNLNETGRAAVKSFIEKGGGYVGICAGAYLATGSYKWSLGLVSAEVADRKHAYRGRATLSMALTPRGREVLGVSGPLRVTYHNGPVLQPIQGQAGSAFEPLAVFQDEISAKNGKKGVMIGSAAIAADRYGKGRIIAISPHPEQTPGLTDIVPRAVQYVAADRRAQ